MMADPHVSRKPVVILALLLFVFTVSSFAQHAAKGSDTGVGVSGQQVAKDPATGKFRAPTPEELKILAPPANNDSTEGLVVRTLPFGVKMVDLEGRFQNYSVATKDPNGKVKTGCVTNTKEAEQFLANSSTEKKESSKKTPPQQSDPSTWEVK
jgi:hypothetical protein